jgi:hypothetical protein
VSGYKKNGEGTHTFGLLREMQNITIAAMSPHPRIESVLKGCMFSYRNDKEKRMEWRKLGTLHVYEDLKRLGASAGLQEPAHTYL